MHVIASAGAAAAAAAAQAETAKSCKLEDVPHDMVISIITRACRPFGVNVAKINGRHRA